MEGLCILRVLVERLVGPLSLHVSFHLILHLGIIISIPELLEARLKLGLVSLHVHHVRLHHELVRIVHWEDSIEKFDKKLPHKT